MRGIRRWTPIWSVWQNILDLYREKSWKWDQGIKEKFCVVHCRLREGIGVSFSSEAVVRFVDRVKLLF